MALRREASSLCESKAEIESFLAHLTSSEQYDEEEGCYYWDNPSGGNRLDSGICTNGAELVAKKFGGKVFGYYLGHGESALVGNTGHDFALVQDRFLVDWWGANVEGTSKPVYDLQDQGDAQEVSKLYLPRESWVRIPERE